MDKEIHIYQNRNRRFFHIGYFLLLTTACLSVTYSMYIQAGDSLLIGFLFVIFLLISPSYIMRFGHHLFKFFSRKPVFVLTKEGIWDLSRIGMRYLIKWDEFEYNTYKSAAIKIFGDQVVLYNSTGLVAILSLQATSITGSDMIHYINRKKQRLRTAE